MEELKNLQKIYSLAAGKFNQYDGNDFVLPRTFKEQVKEINGNSVTYNDYSAIIQTKGSQRGFLNIFCLTNGSIWHHTLRISITNLFYTKSMH